MCCFSTPRPSTPPLKQFSEALSPSPNHSARIHPPSPKPNQGISDQKANDLMQRLELYREPREPNEKPLESNEKPLESNEDAWEPPLPSKRHYSLSKAVVKSVEDQKSQKKPTVPPSQKSTSRGSLEMSDKGGADEESTPDGIFNLAKAILPKKKYYIAD